MKSRLSPTSSTLRLAAAIVLATIGCARSGLARHQQHSTSGPHWEPNLHHHVTRSGHSGESAPQEDGRPLLVDQPLVAHNGSHATPGQPQQNHSLVADSSQLPAFNGQAHKFRVNVSNVCAKNQMRATVRLSKPFFGLIHARDKRRKPACFVEGTGEQAYTLDISYTLVQSERDYCGVVAAQPQPSRAAAAHESSALLAPANQSAPGQQQTLSVVLVVRLHKTIEFSDDRYFLLSCANRCSRPDCSSGAGQQQDSPGPTNQAFRGFVASESIVSPVLRAAAASELGPSARPTGADQSAAGGWSTERCDTLLDLKFQWLIKLCWVLSVLLLLLVSVAAYLCLALGRRRRASKVEGPSSPARDERGKRRTHKQAKQPRLFSQSISQTSESLCWSASGASDELLDSSKTAAIRADDNNLNSPSLASQQQQMMLANLLSGQAQAPNLDESQLAPRIIAASQQQQQQPQHQVLVLGRAADTLAGVQRRHLEARVRRRRSIGGSEAAERAVCAASQQRHSQQQQSLRGQLDASQRAKSRSQATIHYEQSQDPFKAVPFSYLNSGYLSDSAGADGSTFYGVAQQQPAPQQQLAYTLVAAQQPEAAQLDGDQRILAPQQQQQWIAAGYQAAPVEFIEAAGAATGQQQQQQQQQPQTASQFDPQNSRQLISLIQQKHRQQIAQANRTAASMQAQAAKLFAGVGGRAWR